jgi:hypothetical protein
MKLATIINEQDLGIQEKSKFANLLSTLADQSKSKTDMDWMDGNGREMKHADGDELARWFSHVEKDFENYLKANLLDTTNQLDVICDILSRDGNNILTGTRFYDLYRIRVGEIQTKVTELRAALDSESTDWDPILLNNYRTYFRCTECAFTNEERINRQGVINAEEASILRTLADCLGLSNQEVSELNYCVVPIRELDLGELRTSLRDSGIGFVQKKTDTILVPDEVVKVIRRVQGKEVADKFLRRFLKLLREPELNQVCKAHGLPIRGISAEEKIKVLILKGISLRGMLKNDIFKDTPLNERKKRVTEIAESAFEDVKVGGATLDDKVSIVFKHIQEAESADYIGISKSGYHQMLNDLTAFCPAGIQELRDTFEFDYQESITAENLTNLGIHPRDVLECLSGLSLQTFIESKGFSKRGNQIANILHAYRNTEDLWVEQFENLANRDLQALRTHGLDIKEADLGIRFQEVTASMLASIGLQETKELRAASKKGKEQPDVVVQLATAEVLLFEVKSDKKSVYSSYASVSRQIESYKKQLQSAGFQVARSVIVAPDFSDEFIRNAEQDIDLDLLLLPASELKSLFLMVREKPALASSVGARMIKLRRVLATAKYMMG